jgi:hypothetical protein
MNPWHLRCRITDTFESIVVFNSGTVKLCPAARIARFAKEMRKGASGIGPQQWRLGWRTKGEAGVTLVSETL